MVCEKALACSQCIGESKHVHHVRRMPFQNPTPPCGHDNHHNKHPNRSPPCHGRTLMTKVFTSLSSVSSRAMAWMIMLSTLLTLNLTYADTMYGGVYMLCQHARFQVTMVWYG